MISSETFLKNMQIDSELIKRDISLNRKSSVLKDMRKTIVGAFKIQAQTFRATCESLDQWTDEFAAPQV